MVVLFSCLYDEDYLDLEYCHLTRGHLLSLFFFLIDQKEKAELTEVYSALEGDLFFF